MDHALHIYRDFYIHEGIVPGYPASHGCIRIFPLMPGFFFIIGLSREFPGKLSMEAHRLFSLHSFDRKNTDCRGDTEISRLHSPGMQAPNPNCTCWPWSLTLAPIFFPFPFNPAIIP